ncbi:MAG: gliding motility-associated ABC transporter permease subunit GldF [Bacteroidetes bacterium]|nr:MAG: gliding motility-associated ABC transporter permease subunit GldF [Bacteroidota bacterium]PIE88004.1 MAG: gliding motility-associated ABC transporter permease subunit GldF [Bacteroidota bacterium]
MYSLFKKEINSFLNSFIGYIILVVFLVITGLFLWVFPVEFNIPDYGYANINGLFVIGPWVFLFLIPSVTMRSFADERKGGTLELLYTKPLTDAQILYAKYFASVFLVLIALLPTLVYYLSVYRLGLPPGNIDSGAVWGSYLGLFFLGSTFVSIGIFASALSESQVVSFILAVFLCGFMYIGFEFIYTLSLFGSLDLLVRSMGIQAHYASMSRGVVDTRDLLYFLSIIVLFLMLTKLTMERRKW